MHVTVEALSSGNFKFEVNVPLSVCNDSSSTAVSLYERAFSEASNGIPGSGELGIVLHWLATHRIGPDIRNPAQSTPAQICQLLNKAQQTQEASVVLVADSSQIPIFGSLALLAIVMHLRIVVYVFSSRDKPAVMRPVLRTSDDKLPTFAVLHYSDPKLGLESWIPLGSMEAAGPPPIPNSPPSNETIPKQEQQMNSVRKWCSMDKNDQIFDVVQEEM